MSRSRPRRGKGYGGAGLADSSYANECHRCGLDIENTADMAKTSRGKWVHKHCMAGAGDE